MRRAGLILLLVAAGGWDALRTADPDVEEGNRAFHEGRYADALAHYRAAEGRGEDARLHFDMGAALYKMAEKNTDENRKAKLLERAEDEFRRAADTDDLRLKSSAYYNLGNSMYGRKQWDDAIAAYKRALRADPGNEAARHNLEMALRQRPKRDRQPQPGQDPRKGGQGQKQDQKKQQQDRQGGDPGNDRKQGRQDQPDEPKQNDRAGEDAQERDKGKQRGGREQPRSPAPDREPPADPGTSTSDTPTDQHRKLDELERRSRDLRKRLLRQSGKNRDPLRPPSRKDW